MRAEGGGRCSDPATSAEGSIIIQCCFLLLINYLIWANYALSSFFVYWCYEETNSIILCVNLLLHCPVNLLGFLEQSSVPLEDSPSLLVVRADRQVLYEGKSKL